MLAKKKNTAQLGFFSTFRDQLNQKHPLFVLAEQIDWQSFEDAFAPLYCPDNGRPAKPIRLMVGLLMLKHSRDVSDESVVEQWAENSYYQHFCGQVSFVPGQPCEASELVHFRDDLALYRRVLAKDSGKVYSLHEPHVQCISKGKDPKKYELGRAANRNKVSLTVTEKTGVIAGALSLANPYDGHTLPAVIEQYESIFGRAPSEITVDRGYGGRTKIGQTTINIPKPFNDKKLSRYRQNKLRQKFRRRAAIEPVIGHVKSDHRVGRNFYKGIVGDQVNVLLGAAAFNFKRMLNKYKEAFLGLLGRVLFSFTTNFSVMGNAPKTSVVHSVSKWAF